MSMEKFADHVIAVAQKNNMNITNLQLQKVMYFVLKEAKEKGTLTEKQLEELYDEKFQVWAYGPVVRGQYNRFRNFTIRQYNLTKGVFLIATRDEVTKK